MHEYKAAEGGGSGFRFLHNAPSVLGSRCYAVRLLVISEQVHNFIIWRIVMCRELEGRAGIPVQSRCSSTEKNYERLINQFWGKIGAFLKSIAKP